MNFKKHYLLIVALFFVVFANAQYDLNSPKISERLAEKIIQNPDQIIDVVILLEDKVDAEALRKQFDANLTSIAVRTETTIRLLKEKANTTQPDLINTLSNFGVSQDKIQRYWIVNMLKVKMPLNQISALTSLDEIAYLDIQGVLALDEFTTESREDRVEGVDGIMAVNGIEPGLAAINAPKMWALGYTGFGTKALSIDTGVEPTHPAIANHYQGLFTNDSESWFDFGNNSNSPNDCDGHGTHTVGTMLGLDRSTNDTIGVAFDATWMGAQAICGFGSSDNVASLQWAMDPDGNSTTIDDMPTVICNSWYDPSANNSQCGGMYQNLFDAIEAVGIAVVFSAGNDGPGASTITAPKNVNNDLVSVFCVGSLNANNVNLPISGFSSRGPATCGDTGSYLIKPEVSAPGQNVRSADLNGTYSLKSGTSMAAPHVAGAILLLKQAFPTLTGRDLKLALYFSAVDLGVQGEDNVYGMGMIDVYAAYQYLINQGNTPANPYTNRDLAAENLLLPEVVCAANLVIAPITEMINLGTDTIYNAVFRYTLSTGLTDTIQWNGIAITGDTLFIEVDPISLNEGQYSFEIEVELINGQLDERIVNNKQSQSFLLTTLDNVVTQNSIACQGADVLLYASHPSTAGEIRWYEEEDDVMHIANGNSLTVLDVQNDVTYFADFVENTNVGMSDNSIGAGFESNSLDNYLEFDCFRSFILKTVKVYTNTIGGRKIVLTDQFGNIIAQKLFSIPQVGENIITLNWQITEGTNYRLSAEIRAEYYMNSNSANYPYTIQNIVSIRRSNFGLNAYPFFYDWEIEYGNPCGRVPATALVGTGTMDANFSSSIDSIDLQTTNGQVAFIDSSQNVASWFWDFGDGNTSTIQNPTHTYTQPGEYQVYLTATNSTGCSDTKMQIMKVVNFPVTTTPIDVLNENIRVYPNPTNDVLNVAFTNDFQHYNLTLVNAVGQVVWIENNISTDQFQLSVSDYPKGIYFLQIEVDNQRVVRKIVKF
ncbi:MAG: S8 family serine peptidase [Saprospiraceae bacterium]